MKDLVLEIARAAVAGIVEAAKAIHARRAGKRRDASDVLGEHGPLRSSEARERAHEALERGRGEREP